MLDARPSETEQWHSLLLPLIRFGLNRSGKRWTLLWRDQAAFITNEAGDAKLAVELAVTHLKARNGVLAE